MTETPWTDVHEKVLVLAFDNAPLPWLLLEWDVGTPIQRRATSLAETRPALLDLVRASAVVIGRVDYAHGAARSELPPPEAEAIVANDASWRHEGYEVWPVEP